MKGNIFHHIELSSTLISTKIISPIKKPLGIKDYAITKFGTKEPYKTLHSKS